MKGWIAVALFALALGNAQLASATTAEEALIARADELVSTFNRARTNLKSESLDIRAATWKELSAQLETANEELKNVAPDADQGAKLQHEFKNLAAFLQDWKYVTEIE